MRAAVFTGDEVKNATTFAGLVVEPSVFLEVDGKAALSAVAQLGLCRKGPVWITQEAPRDGLNAEISGSHGGHC